nr:hypothetical protein [Lachnospiraceae bacterium]
EETPKEQPVEAKPVEETPKDQTVEETPKDQTVEETPKDQPVEDEPTVKPVEETPAEQTPVQAKPVEDKPKEETPAQEKPKAEATKAGPKVPDYAPPKPPSLDNFNELPVADKKNMAYAMVVHQGALDESLTRLGFGGPAHVEAGDLKKVGELHSRTMADCNSILASPDKKVVENPQSKEYYQYLGRLTKVLENQKEDIAKVKDGKMTEEDYRAKYRAADDKSERKAADDLPAVEDALSHANGLQKMMPGMLVSNPGNVLPQNLPKVVEANKSRASHFQKMREHVERVETQMDDTFNKSTYSQMEYAHRMASVRASTDPASIQRFERQLQGLHMTRGITDSFEFDDFYNSARKFQDIRTKGPKSGSPKDMENYRNELMRARVDLKKHAQAYINERNTDFKPFGRSEKGKMRLGVAQSMLAEIEAMEMTSARERSKIRADLSRARDEHIREKSATRVEMEQDYLRQAGMLSMTPEMRTEKIAQAQPQMKEAQAAVQTAGQTLATNQTLFGQMTQMFMQAQQQMMQAQSQYMQAMMQMQTMQMQMMQMMMDPKMAAQMQQQAGMTGPAPTAQTTQATPAQTVQTPAQTPQEPQTTQAKPQEPQTTQTKLQEPQTTQAKPQEPQTTQAKPQDKPLEQMTDDKQPETMEAAKPAGKVKVSKSLADLQAEDHKPEAPAKQAQKAGAKVRKDEASKKAAMNEAEKKTGGIIM